MSGNHPRITDALWLLAVWVVSSVWCLTASPRLSGVFDEPIYIDCGLEAWRKGTTDPLMAKGVMPLPPMAATLPAYLYERWKGQQIDEREDFGWVLQTARPVSLVFWFFLLFFAQRLGRAFAGPWAGRMAMVLLACDPNLLGHTTLATTDVAITAALLGTAWVFWIGRDRGWWLRVALPGFAFGIAFATKVSGLVFAPMIMAVFWACHFLNTFRTVPDGGWTRRRVGRVVAVGVARGGADAVGIAVIGVLVGLFLAEGGLGRTPVAGTRVEEWVQVNARKTFAGPSIGPWQQRAELALKSPLFPRAMVGIIFQFAHNHAGHGGTFLLGTMHPGSVWYYFPVALSMKLTLPVIVLILTSLIACPKGLLNPVGLAAFTLLLMTPFCRVQIGIRFMFPLMALTYVSLSIALVRGIQAYFKSEATGQVTRFWKRMLPGIVGLALLGAFAEALAAWPDGIRYINILWGGRGRGPRLLADSNVDWGQGLEELQRWHEANGQPELAVWYFGLDPRAARPPFRYCPVDYMPAQNLEQMKAYVGKCCLAVSYNMLLSSAGPRRPLAVELLKPLKPIARTSTFAIYDLRS